MPRQHEKTRSSTQQMTLQLVLLVQRPVSWRWSLLYELLYVIFGQHGSHTILAGCKLQWIKVPVEWILAFVICWPYSLMHLCSSCQTRNRNSSVMTMNKATISKKHLAREVRRCNSYPLLKQTRVSVKLTDRLVSCCNEVIVTLLSVWQVWLARRQLTATLRQLRRCVGNLLLKTTTFCHIASSYNTA